ncbi:MAG: hypothetical protein GC137_00795 [Alphaproteobacteria bacterium]|nr:hypothetical protein [Alphaproteobacteria bacterium]
MTTLIIARHGNTFTPNQTPTRVGARTDLPLVEKGEEQAKALGQYLKNNNLIPDVAYSSTLKRTKDTAKIALKECGVSLPVYALDIFNEIDYGLDENQTEETVIKRIGKKAIEAWDKDAIPPQGWNVNPDQIIKDWQRFSLQIISSHDTVTNNVMPLKEIVLVVTSNGIARFAPHLTEDFDTFKNNHTIKLSTGALGIMAFENDSWKIKDWNIRP